MRTSGTSGRSWSVWKSVFAVVLVLPFVYPLWFLIATATRDADAYNVSPLGFSGFFTSTHLRDAWNSGSLGQGALNSLVAVPVGVVTCCLVSAMAAYWFFRHEGRFAKLLLGLILVGWVIPFAVYLVPFYIEFARLDLTDNLVALGVAYGAIHTPFGVYFMLSYFRQAIPREVLEAGAVDGASILRQFVRIVLPLSRPAVGHARRARVRVDVGRDHRLRRPPQRPVELHDRALGQRARRADAAGRRERQHRADRGRGDTHQPPADAQRDLRGAAGDRAGLRIRRREMTTTPSMQRSRSAARASRRSTRTARRPWTRST